ncbi:MAG: hypothetical protein ABIJ91_00920 [Candidatus Kuenenbacteria bacterium]
MHIKFNRLPQAIKIKLKSLLVDNLLVISLKLNVPFLTAVAFKFAASRINRHGEYKVLVLGRSIFTDDIKAMAVFSGQINYTILHLKYLDAILNHFIKQPERARLAEDNYHIADIGAKGKLLVNAYLVRVMPFYKKLTGLQAVVSANFGYIQQQELAKVCQAQKIPFIIIHKEGMGAPSSRVSLYKNYHFIADKILLYNNQIKDFLSKVIVPGLTPDKMEIVGVPRLDFYFKKDKKDKASIDKKQLVFFAFHPDDKFVPLIHSQDNYQAARLRTKDFFCLVMRFVAHHPEINVIIKTKAAKHYLTYIQNIFSENFSAPIPNLTITHSGNPIDLIQNSDVVIGFHSTTLIEALIAGKTIVSPYFEDVIDDQAGSHFKDYPTLINYAVKEDDLKSYIYNSGKNNNKDIQSLKEEFLRKWIFIPDGHASQRAENAIIKTINELSIKGN